jgi:hypothetical protein
MRINKVSVLSWNCKCAENSSIETFVTKGITAFVKCITSWNFPDLKAECANKGSRCTV